MDESDLALRIILLTVIAFILFLISLGFDILFIHPIAADAANEHCKEIGLDQYKSFSRVGLFSKNPIGIKCEYAEKYTDLGVRVN